MIKESESILKKNKKKLYIEPEENYLKRRKVYFNLMLLGPGGVLIFGIIVFIYFTIFPFKDEDPFCALGVTLPIGTGVRQKLHYL